MKSGDYRLCTYTEGLSKRRYLALSRSIRRTAREGSAWSPCVKCKLAVVTHVCSALTDVRSRFLSLDLLAAVVKPRLERAEVNVEQNTYEIGRFRNCSAMQCKYQFLEKQRRADAMQCRRSFANNNRSIDRSIDQRDQRVSRSGEQAAMKRNREKYEDCGITKAGEPDAHCPTDPRTLARVSLATHETSCFRLSTKHQASSCCFNNSACRIDTMW